MPFSADMTESLKNFKVGVIGASGTGSIVIENLARLGVGHLVLIDDDVIEYKNLNRIQLLIQLFRTLRIRNSKVKVLADVINQYRFDVVLTALDSKIGTQQAILEVATCDVLFSCVDTVPARMYRFSWRVFSLPVFDIGVTIPTGSKDGKTFLLQKFVLA